MRWKLTSGVVFLHDNACPHTASRALALLELFSLDLFDYPSHSPDLDPNDWRLLLIFAWKIRWDHGSSRINNNEDLIEAVRSQLNPQAADLFGPSIQKHMSLQVPQCRRWIRWQVAEVRIHFFLFYIVFLLVVLLGTHWKLLSEKPRILSVSTVKVNGGKWNFLSEPAVVGRTRLANWLSLSACA
jgi:hypothetical protein